MVDLPAPVELLLPGTVPYPEALALQENLRRRRLAGEIGDTLVLLEHPPVITLGLSGGREDLKTTPEALERLGVELHETDRGGRATLHSPGQMVAYPVFKIEGIDLHAFLWKLEESVLLLLDELEIPAGRKERYPGVWTGGEKIAAVGLAVRDGVTSHGLALNVNNDLGLFDLITPCGIREFGVTSIQNLLDRPLPMEAVQESFIRCFSTAFGREVVRSRAGEAQPVIAG